MPDIDTYALHFLFFSPFLLFFIRITYLKYLDSHSTEAAVAHMRFSYISTHTEWQPLGLPHSVCAVLCCFRSSGQTRFPAFKRTKPKRDQTINQMTAHCFKAKCMRNISKDIYCTAQEQCTFPRYWFLSHSIKYIHLLIQHQTRLYYLYTKAACAFISSCHRQRYFLKSQYIPALCCCIVCRDCARRI